MKKIDNQNKQLIENQQINNKLDQILKSCDLQVKL